jgi:hypothetical protein
MCQFAQLRKRSTVAAKDGQSTVIQKEHATLRCVGPVGLVEPVTRRVALVARCCYSGDPCPQPGGEKVERVMGGCKKLWARH